MEIKIEVKGRADPLNIVDGLELLLHDQGDLIARELKRLGRSTRTLVLPKGSARVIFRT